MHRQTRFFLLSAGFAAITIATAVVDRLVIAARSVCTVFVDLGRWLVAKMPRPLQSWLSARRRVGVHGGVQRAPAGVLRRPIVMANAHWRMCPST